MNNPKTITAKVYVLGDNIDTDQIIPAEFLNLVPTIPAEYEALGAHALAGLPESATPFINSESGKSDYPIIIAGKNFGCGSSREHAPICLGAAGVKAVIAASFARIFFRNAVATGELYPLESQCPVDTEFHTGDTAALNIADGTLTRLPDNQRFNLKPLGAVAPVVKAGGIFSYARQAGMIK